VGADQHCAPSHGIGGWGIEKVATWSRLRRLALDGFKLQAVAVVPTDVPRAVCSAAARLRVGPLLGGAFAGMPGAFCDARLKTTCGAAFDVHRAVLAAASPVFASMLAGGMAEAAAAEAELRCTTAEAAGLLVAHIYGETIEVPLSAALQLYALADAYQIRSGLAQQLRMWLGALRLPPAELAALVPAAAVACEAAFTSSLASQAAAAAAELATSPDRLRGWPLSAAVAVVKEAELLPAFQLASAWVGAWDSTQEQTQRQQRRRQQHGQDVRMDAQQQQQPMDDDGEAAERGLKRQQLQSCGGQPGGAAPPAPGATAALASAERAAHRIARWAALVEALPFGKGTRADLRAVAAAAAKAKAAGAPAIPGLHERLYETADALIGAE
jgi:hypothetical protein